MTEPPAMFEHKECPTCQAALRRRAETGAEWAAVKAKNA
jgi:hypothetical protein